MYTNLLISIVQWSHPTSVLSIHITVAVEQQKLYHLKVTVSKWYEQETCMVKHIKFAMLKNNHFYYGEPDGHLKIMWFVKGATYVLRLFINKRT